MGTRIETQNVFHVQSIGFTEFIEEAMLSTHRHEIRLQSYRIEDGVPPY